MTDRRFDDAYRESVRLGDGTEAELRLVQPEDAQRLQAGFDKLSARSRYLRFFGTKKELSDGEAKRLTVLDGQHEMAIGALETGADVPMGVARFAQSGAAWAEAAVVVVDEFQGRGLGRVLLTRLGAAAAERGVEELRFEALAENRALVGLVKKVFPGAAIGTVRDGTVTVRVRPSAPEGTPSAGPTPAGSSRGEV